MLHTHAREDARTDAHIYIIPGDYNIRRDKPGEIETEQLMELLHSANMVQHVNERTKISGHTIDLVVRRECRNILNQIHVSSTSSDHSVVQAKLI